MEKERSQLKGGIREPCAPMKTSNDTGRHKKGRERSDLWCGMDDGFHSCGKLVTFVFELLPPIYFPPESRADQSPEPPPVAL